MIDVVQRAVGIYSLTNPDIDFFVPIVVEAQQMYLDGIPNDIRY